MMAVSPLEAALIETWTLFAFGSITIMLRIFCRTRMVGFAGYCGDDYLIFFGWVSRSSYPYTSQFMLKLSGLLYRNDSSSSHRRWYR
jgi:hypothetical protein